MTFFWRWQPTADLIVSGDSNLLSLNPYRGFPIVTPAAFVRGVVRQG
jgi:predicted nucleic acid-binding protein